MAMQEFRVPTSYKVDVDTVDRSIEGASIVASGTRQMLFKLSHRVEPRLTFRTSTRWWTNKQGGLYCPLTPVWIRSSFLKGYNSWVRILVGRYLTEDDVPMFEVATTDELLTPNRLVRRTADFDVYVRYNWVMKDFLCSPETYMNWECPGAKYWEQRANAEILSEIRWGIMHSIVDIDEIAVDKAELLEEYMRRRLACEGELDLSHKRKDAAILYLKDRMTV